MSPEPDAQLDPERRELQLAAWEADLNRREASMRRTDESHSDEEELTRRLAAADRNERELEEMLATVRAQRERLERLRLEYEARCRALGEQTRAIELERTEVHEERQSIHEERESIHAERESLRAEREALSTERELLRHSQAQLVQASIAQARIEHVLDQTSVDADRALEAEVASAYSDADSDVRWWEKQLGFPLGTARPAKRHRRRAALY
jgi:hypothetical protein